MAVRGRFLNISWIPTKSLFGNASAKKCQGRSKAVETKGDSVAVKQTSREQVPGLISPLLEQQNSGNARTTRSCLCLAGACNILYEVHKNFV